ncbi:MAG TPA: hypothetical protein RMH26_29910, partial [Polyangiaceae bacterium LLY-WYZ-15_(1-7)]|nr:hypothetical protein [Polyangiaceae bacterium LLY-WYZ-15_(1-7)]
MLAAFGGLTGCSELEGLTPPPLPSGRADSDAGPDGSMGFPDSGIGGTRLTVARVEPGHGPFTGGNSALVRGTGFTAEAIVTVGGRMVQPADTERIDGNRLAIVLPAGEPGP